MTNAHAVTTRAALGICDRVVLDRTRTVTVVPTSPRVPECEVDVMDATGSVQTVRVDRLGPEGSLLVVDAFLCEECGHRASRSSEPWDNQYRCTECPDGRCKAMFGCAPGKVRRS